MSEVLLTSLAILNVNWEKGRDYLSNFVPFVSECIRTAPQPEVSVPVLQRVIFERFGLKIPQGVLDTVLKLVHRQGHIKYVQGVYVRNEQALRDLGFLDLRTEVLRKQKAVLDKLVEFCKGRYGTEWTEDQAEQALLGYLHDNSLSVFASTTGGVPAIPSPPEVPHADFLVKAFIVDLESRDPAGFAYLETIVKGSMLADVLMFPNPRMPIRPLSRVKVFFDTRFLLRALGYEGPSMQAPCRELINLLYMQNADLRCFKHTLDEVHGVLQGAASALRQPDGIRESYGESLEYFIREKYTAGDVELAIARLVGSLDSLNVLVEPKPLHSRALEVDEEGLESILQKDVGYHKREALIHDLDCLTSIYRLRGGRSCSRIELCDAIFATTNSALIRASDHFFKEELGETSAVPCCILDRVLTTVVWLANPLRAPELPRRRIIADCYAALNPSGKLWDLYIKEVRRLETAGNISESDVHLLRFSIGAREALMGMTLGDPNAFTAGSVEEVLERACAEARAETENELYKERAMRKEAERKAAGVSASYKAKDKGQQDRIDSVSRRIGRYVGRCVATLFITVICLGGLFSIWHPNTGGVGLVWWRILVAVGLAVFLLGTILNLVLGETVRSLIRRLELSVSNKVKRFLTWITNP